MRSERVGGFMLIPILALACSRPPTTGPIGDALPGLTDSQQAAFLAGRSFFNKVFTAEEGLGPMFNENQCSACHTDPAPGGIGGIETVQKGTRMRDDGSCDLLEHEGGENVRTQATLLMKALGVERETAPPSASHLGRFTTPPLFGLGLVEAIPNDAILARVDSLDDDRDGISGRPGRTLDGRLGRFGRKAEHATIAEFNATALRLELGLTNPLAPDEALLNGAPLPEGTDPAADPEISPQIADYLTSFVRFLVPPEQEPYRSEAHRDSVEQGKNLFGRIGCVKCHVPSMTTAPSDIPALNRKKINLYSDLLLHDMGPGLSNVCAPYASPGELRTAMLMGLRYRDRYLHDGRVMDLREAVAEHGGEAQLVKELFDRIGWVRQEYIIKFLQTL